MSIQEHIQRKKRELEQDSYVMAYEKLKSIIKLSEIDELRNKPTLKRIFSNKKEFIVIAGMKMVAKIQEEKSIEEKIDFLNENVDAICSCDNYQYFVEDLCQCYEKKEFEEKFNFSNRINIPLISTDIIISTAQILKAKDEGADAIILMAGLLENYRIREFRKFAEALKMDVILEIDDMKGLNKAIDLGFSIIFINNVDYNTGEVKLERTINLADKIPDTKIVISSHGIKTMEDVEYIKDAKIDGVLMCDAFVNDVDVKSFTKGVKDIFNKNN